jgi:hypothetical protein
MQLERKQKGIPVNRSIIKDLIFLQEELGLESYSFDLKN